MPTVRRIAQRAGYRCSNPSCLRPTVGPDSGGQTASIGVAAHITAAAERGPRYDSAITSAERSAAENGIWLCQTCSRLVDVDPVGHTVNEMREWKTLAEMRAYLGLRGLAVVNARSFEKLEAKAPDLVSEMRTDIASHPFVRLGFARHKKYTYNGPEEVHLVYYHEDHEHLQGKLKVMSNYGAIVDTSYGDAESFEFTEDFVEYLELPIR